MQRSHHGLVSGITALGAVGVFFACVLAWAPVFLLAWCVCVLQDFANMPIDEVRANINSRRDRIFLLMEELRRLRIQQRLKVRGRVRCMGLCVRWVCVSSCHTLNFAASPWWLCESHNAQHDIPPGGQSLGSAVLLCACS